MNMHKQERAALSALVRDDLLSFGTKCFGTVWPGQRFQPNWHHKSITYELTRLHKGENNRLIIAQPPRTLKSLFA